MLKFIGSLTIAALVATFALVGPVGVQPTYACTGAWPPMDEVAKKAHAIAIVRALEVGGPDYTIPPLTPTPTATATASSTASATETGTMTPASTPTTPSTATAAATASTRPANFDPTGYGAKMLVERTIVGSLSTEINVDAGIRLNMERQLRQMEMPPPKVLPCPVNFLVPKYEAGKTYVMFLRFEDGNWTNTPPMYELNDGVVSGIWGQMSLLVYEAFIARPGDDIIPVMDEGKPWPLERPLVAYERIEAPLDAFVNAIRLARGDIEAPPKPAAAAPTATSTPRATTITPPDTGNAGLR